MIFEQWIEEAKLRVQNTTQGPWKWEAEGCELVTLSGPNDGFVLAAYACQTCAQKLKALPQEEHEKIDRHCMWPNKVVGDFIEHSRIDLEIAIEIVDIVTKYAKRWKDHSDPKIALWFTGIMEEMELIFKERTGENNNDSICS